MSRAGNARRERHSRPQTGSGHALTSRPRRPVGGASLSSFRSIRRRLGGGAGRAGGPRSRRAGGGAPGAGGQCNQTANLIVGYGALDVAQGFTTGTNPDGYHVAGVQIRIVNLATGTTAKVATALPGTITEAATLGEAAPPASGDYVNFMAPASTRLAADTTYWVVIQGSSGEMSGTSSRAWRTPGAPRAGALPTTDWSGPAARRDRSRRSPAPAPAPQGCSSLATLVKLRPRATNAISAAPREASQRSRPVCRRRGMATAFRRCAGPVRPWMPRIALLGAIGSDAARMAGRIPTPSFTARG